MAERENPGLGPHPDANKGIYSNHNQANKTKRLAEQVHEGSRSDREKAMKELARMHGGEDKAIKVVATITRGTAGGIRKLLGR